MGDDNEEKTLAEMMLDFTDTMGTIIESVAGYRQMAEEAGFSPTAAEAMAVDMHRMMMCQTMTTSGGKD